MAHIMIGAIIKEVMEEVPHMGVIITMPMIQGRHMRLSLQEVVVLEEQVEIPAVEVQSKSLIPY